MTESAKLGTVHGLGAKAPTEIEIKGTNLTKGLGRIINV